MAMAGFEAAHHVGHPSLRLHVARGLRHFGATVSASGAEYHCLIHGSACPERALEADSAGNGCCLRSHPGDTWLLSLVD